MNVTTYHSPVEQGPNILVVDNYDSFVFTIVGYLEQLGATCTVARNDTVSADEAGDYDGVLLSPGPGTPEDAGVCLDMVAACARTAQPMLGVCLGHQALGVVMGATVGRAPELLHGKTSLVEHDGTGVLEGLASPFPATRYHSLAIDPATMPDELRRQRPHGQRDHHGRPAYLPAAARSPVPPGERAHRGRAPDPRQLAGPVRRPRGRDPVGRPEPARRTRE